MTARRVLHVGKYLPPERGGMETSIYLISEGLSAIPALDVRLVGSNTSHRREHKQINKHFGTTKLSRIKELFSTPIVQGLDREIAEFDPDIIHLHLPNPFMSWALRKSKRPLVITYHCEILTYPTLLKCYAPILQSNLRAARKIIATSNEAIEFSPFLPSFKDKCAVVPLGTLPVSPKLEKSDTVKQIESQHGPGIVLFVGRLVPYKGLHHLIRAMQKVEGKLVVVGDGPLLSELQRLVAELGLTSKVAFLGSVSDETLEAYFRAARVVALTSLDEREAFGMCLIEALARGRPLVTTRVRSGVQFVNQDGATGFQVGVGDIPAISSALTRLLTDHALWERFSRQAKKHFHDHFAISAVARKYHEIYSEVL